MVLSAAQPELRPHGDRTIRGKGVEVEVWSEHEAPAPFPSDVPIHRGSLREALARVRPDLVHTHWLHMAQRYSAKMQAAGLPLTVRGHGYEFSPEVVAILDQNPVIRAVYLFPHLAARCYGISEKIRPFPATFNPSLYRPSQNKDRQLVMRTGAALPTKDYLTFMQAARLCPDHRFVLVLCRENKPGVYLQEIIAMRDQLGAPVEIHTDWQHEEVAGMMSQAGIYFHTNGPDSPFGMPISIIEAMATGSYIISRRCPGSAEYIHDAGNVYDTVEEAAALICQTEGWSKRNGDGLIFARWIAPTATLPVRKCWSGWSPIGARSPVRRSHA